MASETWKDQPIQEAAAPAPSLAAEATHQTCATFASFLRGFSQACAAAFGELESRLSPYTVTRMDPRNGIIAGLAAGNSRFFEEMAKVSRHTYDVFQKAMPTTSTTAPIDYDRLSRMVAEEMRKHSEKPPSTYLHESE